MQIGEGIANNLAGTSSPQQNTTCHHPVNCTSNLEARNLGFGLRVAVTWESPTGTLGDLSSCRVSEEITYSTIPNPPFGSAPGVVLSESGQTQRIPAGGIAASAGRAQDTHRHPRGLVLQPPSAGTYRVDQTYDYNCSVCNSGWVPFVSYTIVYDLSQNTTTWIFRTSKTGPGGPFESVENV